MAAKIKTERGIERLLMAFLGRWLERRGDRSAFDRTETYADAGLMTRDNGVVLTLGDAVYQITIVRVR